MLVLGIDQSYKKTGIALVSGSNILNAKVVKVRSIAFKKSEVEGKSNTSKRKYISDFVKHCITKYEPDLVVCERIRTFSKGFISTNYIKSTGALIATILDAIYPQKLYSADTRSWKAKIIGSSKGNKEVSSKYILQRFGLRLNDDAADAVCIALYGLQQYKSESEIGLLKQERG